MISVELSGVTTIPLGNSIPPATCRAEPSGVTGLANVGIVHPEVRPLWRDTENYTHVIAGIADHHTLDAARDFAGVGLTGASPLVLVVNPKMPVIQADISGLADLASTYAVAAPDLVRAASTLATTNTTTTDATSSLLRR